ncbi:MAG TPA: hypothetical protein PLQ56_18325 [Aggregatilineales bacterium]|nr:hypothetical protein [Aggregatilineales bacterium]
MPVSLQWDNDEQTILRYDYCGRWTWEEYAPVFERASILLRESNWTVHFIVHLKDEVARNHLPAGALVRVVNIFRNAPATAGKTIIVNAGMVYRTVAQTGAAAYPAIGKKYGFADTLEEARLMLAAEPTEDFIR